MLHYDRPSGFVVIGFCAGRDSATTARAVVEDHLIAVNQHLGFLTECIGRFAE